METRSGIQGHPSLATREREEVEREKNGEERRGGCFLCFQERPWVYLVLTCLPADLEDPLSQCLGPTPLPRLLTQQGVFCTCQQAAALPLAGWSEGDGRADVPGSSRGPACATLGA